MQTLTQNIQTDSRAYRTFAVVIACEKKDYYILRSDEGITANARLAVSCLIEPAIHDRVVIEKQDGESAYITAILERKSEVVPEIIMQDGLQLSVKGSGLKIVSEKGVELSSLNAISIVSEKLELRAEEGSIFIANLSYLGGYLMGKIEKVTILGTVMDSIISRVTQKFKSSHRIIDEMDYVKSRHMDYQASHNMRLHGKNTLLTAKELVKVDGDQIHLG